MNSPRKHLLNTRQRAPSGDGGLCRPPAGLSRPRRRDVNSPRIGSEGVAGLRPPTINILKEWHSRVSAIIPEHPANSQPSMFAGGLLRNASRSWASRHLAGPVASGSASDARRGAEGVASAPDRVATSARSARRPGPQNAIQGGDDAGQFLAEKRTIAAELYLPGANRRCDRAPAGNGRGDQQRAFGAARRARCVLVSKTTRSPCRCHTARTESAT